MVDTTAPTVVSITRTLGTSPTHEDVLRWFVEFSEEVRNVDAADLAVTGTSATASDVSATSMGRIWLVTVSGGDLADLTGTVMLGFADDQDIADKAGNSLTATTPTGDNEEYVVDNTRPTVTITGVPAISRAPFTATITFNEPVQEFFQTQIIADNATLSAFHRGHDGGDDARHGLGRLR